MRARTGLWEPRGGNAPGPPGPMCPQLPGSSAGRSLREIGRLMVSLVIGMS